MNSASDTLQISKFLQDKDFSATQAEALAEITKRLDEGQKDQLVTKDFLAAEMARLRTEMYQALFVHGLLVVGAIIAAAKFL